MGKKTVERPEFEQIKLKLRYSKNYGVIATMFKRSIATVVRVDQSKTFEEFKRLVRAEHPPLRDKTIGKQFSRLVAKLLTDGHITKDDLKWIKTGIRNA